MKYHPALNWLVPLVGLLAAIAAFAGLFWPGGGQPSVFTTLRGQTVDIYGQGLYQYDMVISAATFKGTDAVTLLVGIPLLAVAFVLARRGSLRGSVLLACILSYFLYVGASMALGAAYNNFFLVYIGLLSASFYAFILAFTAIDTAWLAARVSPRLPRRGIAVAMFVFGFVPLALWMGEILAALAAGHAPELLGSTTTMITHALDLAIIVPAAYLAGILLLRRAPLGYLLSCVILFLLAMVGVVVISQTAFQLLFEIYFSPAQVAAFIGSWIIASVVAAWLAIVMLRSFPGSAAQKTA